MADQSNECNSNSSKKICPGRSDWQVGISLKDQMNSLVQNEFLSDVCFLVNKVDDQQDLNEEKLMQQLKRFPGHKNILASSSPVFESMFVSPFGQEKEIKVLDIESEAFAVVLK